MAQISLETLRTCLDLEDQTKARPDCDDDKIKPTPKQVPLQHEFPLSAGLNGVHPKVASERLGHSKVAIRLDLYSHVLPNMQADAAAIVDDALRAVLNRRQNKG